MYIKVTKRIKTDDKMYHEVYNEDHPEFDQKVQMLKNDICLINTVDREYFYHKFNVTTTSTYKQVSFSEPKNLQEIKYLNDNKQCPQLRGSLDLMFFKRTDDIIPTIRSVTLRPSIGFTGISVASLIGEDVRQEIRYELIFENTFKDRFKDILNKVEEIISYAEKHSI